MKSLPRAERILIAIALLLPLLGAALMAPEAEKKIRETVTRAQADLRTIHVALESYFIDYNEYPTEMRQLTTPIAYITRAFNDPFLAESDEITSPVAWLRFTMTPEPAKLVIWSVGPDLADQRAEIEYDPTNGTISAGDILRRDLKPDYLSIESPELRLFVERQKKELENARDAVFAYYARHRALPTGFEQIRNAGIPFTTPPDLYRNGAPSTFRTSEDAASIILYSFGPDGDDDGGRALAGRYARGSLPDGDIAVTVEAEELIRRFGGGRLEEVLREPIMLDLLALQAHDGRPNAMIHYVRASALMPPLPDNRDMIKKTTEEGWSNEANVLRPWLVSCEPMIEETLKGVALDEARNVGWEKGPETPVPNFLAAQTCARALLLDGRRLEYEKQPVPALDNYLAVLTMGRDFTATSGTLISHLISVVIQRMAVTPLCDLIQSGTLGREDLIRARDRLAAIEATTPGIDDGFQGELECMRWNSTRLRTDPEYRRKMLEDPDVRKQWPDEATMLASLDRFEADYGTLFAQELATMRMPWWRRDEAAIERRRSEMLEGMEKLVGNAFPNFTEALVRWLVTREGLRAARIAAALEFYKLDHNRYPARLADLAPEYLAEIPIDPCTGQTFWYTTPLWGGDYSLQGAGPDRIADDPTLRYDPTNGTLSTGDVIFR